MQIFEDFKVQMSFLTFPRKVSRLQKMKYKNVQGQHELKLYLKFPVFFVFFFNF